jgi:hypothetical protein
MTTYFAQALQKNKTKTLFTNLNKCPVCESTFSDNEGHGKFCSKACSSKIEKMCIICNKKIISKKPDKFCSKACRDVPGKIKLNEKRKAEGGVQCLICGDYGKSLALHLKKLHNISAEDYRNQYGGKTVCESTSTKLSELTSGENNPWYNHGGTISPFSKNNKKFIGLSEEEKQQKVNEAVDAYIKTTPKENRPMNVEYWIKRGMTEEEAKAQVSKRQTTFSLEKCIERYGEEAGKARWQERQEKWHKNYKKSNYSQVSQRLFFNLVEEYPDAMFAEHGSEFVFRTKTGSVFKLDFWVPSSKHLIEFDGDYWHGKRDAIANPNRSANRDKQILETDSEIKILHVKERDFYKDPEGTIQKCKDFLKT